MLMRCLSVHQGWAWGLVHGPKDIENRSWDTPYRGPIVIHASKSLASIREARALMPEMPPDDLLVFGAALGVVDLIEIRPVADPSVSANRFASGPRCWMVKNPRPLLEPYPLRGMQGLFMAEIPDRLLPPRG